MSLKSYCRRKGAIRIEMVKELYIYSHWALAVAVVVVEVYSLGAAHFPSP